MKHIRTISGQIRDLSAKTEDELFVAAKELQAPFELSWSCYKSEGKACGLCDSCARRLRAFAHAGLFDPIDYEERPLYI
jgi:7-cyano-7-deazaguanine synthase